MVTDNADTLRLFAKPKIVATVGSPAGVLLLRSADPLGKYPLTVVHSLREWAHADPGHLLIAERNPDGGWRGCSYGEAVAAADAIGQALLDLGLGPGRPLMLLSGNSVDHLLLMLGAMTAGVPVAPVSVAYSLQSQDHARIEAIAALIGPGAVFADDAARFAPALDALTAVPAIISRGTKAGAEVKLIPVEDAYEIRVKGPMVTPGYFGRPDLTAEAFDEDGFSRVGDAVTPANPGDPNAGLLFRGRLAEDFKLATGTFVHVGAVRTALLSAVPVLADAVLAGENRAFVCALAWLNAAEAAKVLDEDPTAAGELVSHPGLLELLARALAAHNDAAGSSARVERLLVMTRVADLDAEEITDKGYVNQRKVLVRRAALVEMLYAEPAPAGVVMADHPE